MKRHFLTNIKISASELTRLGPPRRKSLRQYPPADDLAS